MLAQPIAFGLALLSCATAGVMGYPFPPNDNTTSGFASLYHPSQSNQFCPNEPVDDSEAVATIPNQMAEYHFCYLALGVDRDGRKMEAKIVDLKQGMADNEIYLSPGAFYQIANEGETRVPVTWT